MATDAAVLFEYLRSLRRAVHVALEEGTPAQWLHDVLAPWSIGLSSVTGGDPSTGTRPTPMSSPICSAAAGCGPCTMESPPPNVERVDADLPVPRDESAQRSSRARGTPTRASLKPDLSDVRVTRIVTAVDCGLTLNPLGLDGQTESSIAWGLSAALCGKIGFRDGAAVQRSYIVSTKFREAQ